MRNTVLLIALVASAWFPGRAAAAPLTISKTATVVSDPLGNLVPRSVPGSVIDYRVLATNPLANLGRPVNGIVLVDPLPDHLVLRVSDLTAGRGPIEFTDGNLLGTGLAASGLGLAYSTTDPANDGVEFWDGATWSYQPVADAEGYDPKVRAVRLRLTGSFATVTSFQIRYRMKIR